MQVKHVKNKIMKKYKLSTIRLSLLWLQNYDARPSFQDSFRFVKFESMEACIDYFVNRHAKVQDENDFRFRLLLDTNETEALECYLLDNKDFFINYIQKEGYFVGTHLYQLYLQYLFYKLNQVEISLFLDGYFHMMSNLYGKDYTLQRKKLEKEFRLIS